jgi:hypothetical protein
VCASASLKRSDPGGEDDGAKVHPRRVRLGLIEARAKCAAQHERRMMHPRRLRLGLIEASAASGIPAARGGHPRHVRLKELRRERQLASEACALGLLEATPRDDPQERPPASEAHTPRMRRLRRTQAPRRPGFNEAEAIEAKKPWLKLEMSRRTWYRRQAEKRKGRE